MFRGLKLFWESLATWQKVLVAFLFPIALALLVAYLVGGKEEPKVSVDDYLEEVKKNERQKQKELEGLEEEITEVFRQKTLLDEEIRHDAEELAHSDSIADIDRVLLERRTRRQANRRGGD